MKTRNTERLALYAITFTTIAGWAFLVTRLADSLLYPSIV